MVTESISIILTTGTINALNKTYATFLTQGNEYEKLTNNETKRSKGFYSY